jgi:hypothetical protein
MTKASSRIDRNAKSSTEFIPGGLYEDGTRVVMCILGFNPDIRSLAIRKNGVVLHSNIDDEIGGVVLDIDSGHCAFTDFRGTLVLES